MKTGRTITELAQEIERQAKTKKDFVARPAAMSMHTVGDNGVALHVGDHQFAINDVAHEHVRDYLNIPAVYYDRMLEKNQALLCTNVNAWFDKRDAKDKRMVRTLDSTARAIVSDAYRPLDYADMLEAVLPPLIGGGAEVVSCQVTDRRLYIKAVEKKVQREVMKKTGHKIGDGSHAFFKDIVCPAITISNSEVGEGSLSVRASIWTAGCTNFAVTSERGVRKQHVGKRHELGDDLVAVLSDKTRRLKDAALWSEISDVVKGAFDAVMFEARVERLSEMAEDKIVGNPTEVLEVTRRHFGFTETETGSVMRYLIEGGDLSRYGLFNAITRTAEDLDSYDRASFFERAGGDVIELGKAEWKKIAEAA